MKAIRLKTTTAPKVYFSEGASRDWSVQKHACALACKAVGLIVMKYNSGNGFPDEKNGVFAHYVKERKCLVVQTMEEMKDGLIVPEV
ncbi:hypothetical protein [Petrimonas sulfuriphila]|uniref:hypothetical protein n=1 Tax=Petrimonas sulfuriphila TaxID=285070 RepID=UPI003EBFEF56